MAWTQDDVDALDEAYRGGEKSITTSDGKRVDLRGVDEYMRLRKAMLAEVNASSSKPASYSVARLRRGS